MGSFPKVRIVKYIVDKTTILFFQHLRLYDTSDASQLTGNPSKEENSNYSSPFGFTNSLGNSTRLVGLQIVQTILAFSIFEIGLSLARLNEVRKLSVVMLRLPHCRGSMTRYRATDIELPLCSIQKCWNTAIKL